MATVTKTIGRLPQYVGDWEQRTSPNGYKRRNRVTMFGSEFESLVDNNTQVPATYNSQTGVVTVNTQYWTVISNALDAYVFSQKWPTIEQEIALDKIDEGTCSTAADTAAKQVVLEPSFILSAGTKIIITFANGISVANATLAIGKTVEGETTYGDPKAIYYRGAALAADLVKENAKIMMSYNGTQWEIVGDLYPEVEAAFAGTTLVFTKGGEFAGTTLVLD